MYGKDERVWCRMPTREAQCASIDESHLNHTSEILVRQGIFLNCALRVREKVTERITKTVSLPWAGQFSYIAMC